jgi:hypothetical protein
VGWNAWVPGLLEGLRDNERRVLLRTLEKSPPLDQSFPTLKQLNYYFYLERPSENCSAYLSKTSSKG